MAKKPARAGRNPRPSALVRAEHGGAEVSLTPAQRTILADVLREGEDFREEVESAVLRYGRSLLDKVFGGDTSAALAGNFGWAPPTSRSQRAYGQSIEA